MSYKPSAPFSSSYKTRQQPSGEPTPTRPKLSKEASDNLLSYYSSPIADEGRDYSQQRSPEKPQSNRAHVKAKKASAVASTSSSSDYSDDSEVTDARDIPSEASSSVARRSGTPSKGGADKRRIAIVQMDHVSDTARKSNSDTASTNNSIRSRRGNANSFAGLALVAPPDAAVQSYAQLTPPSTAPPAAADNRSNSHLMDDHENGRHRSSSASPAGRLSRDTYTGSVGSAQGTRAAAAPILPADNDKTKKNTKPDDKYNLILAPLDVSQRSATSQSSSPATHSDPVDCGRNVVSPLDRMSSPQMMSPLPIVTPSIGEGKEIDKPVAGPVVVKLDNLASKTSHSTASWRSDSPTPSHGSASIHGSTYSSSATSSYLRYEPAI
ncbi:hypothetical protein HYPSUDRAFT_38607 [Hypholoma sublateritium FD-334 SS-4]|uniref:Uncharacterized protein n=1 Tax=Hypholoma sublateritium (strain FD-334 SS-4) TaxID=945553 RepID=A0A0D2P0Y1_HYPSF|nr:hypothetical protein HYPSUDRAFT_38607 [Hypholoma sublateritium FD-334 SS-4]